MDNRLTESERVSGNGCDGDEIAEVLERNVERLLRLHAWLEQNSDLYQFDRALGMLEPVIAKLERVADDLRARAAIPNHFHRYFDR